VECRSKFEVSVEMISLFGLIPSVDLCFSFSNSLLNGTIMGQSC
jgi:hypothetical protein